MPLAPSCAALLLSRFLYVASPSAAAAAHCHSLDPCHCLTEDDDDNYDDGDDDDARFGTRSRKREDCEMVGDDDGGGDDGGDTDNRNKTDTH